MGWTYTHREAGLSDREFFEREFPQGLTKHGRIVACATVRNVFYAAVANVTGETWAMVVLIQRTRGEYNFGYKDMDETMGPCEAAAPAAVLEALSPTDSEWAQQWRAKCRANLAAKAARPKVKRGDTVIFAEPLTFINGDVKARFVYEHGSSFTSQYGRYRITNWRSRAYSVERADRSSAGA